MANNSYQFAMSVKVESLKIQNQGMLTQDRWPSFKDSNGIEMKKLDLQERIMESRDFQNAKLEQEQIIYVFMCLIKKLLEGNTEPDSVSIKEKQSCFTSIRNMFQKIYTLVKGQVSCFVTAMILLDRVHSFNDNLSLNFANILPYISAAMLVAFKYCDDSPCFNSELAQRAEIDKRLLNKMEIRFLSLLNFELYIDSCTYERYEKKIWNYSQRQKKSFMCSTQ